VITGVLPYLSLSLWVLLFLYFLQVMQSKEFAVVVADSESDAVGQAAADAVEKIEQAINARGVANVVFYPAVGLFEALLAKEVDWKKVVGFQLGEKFFFSFWLFVSFMFFFCFGQTSSLGWSRTTPDLVVFS
jgi:hypothetical protein